MTQENNKKIAKNTLFLYIRMLLIMGVSLYTVRVVLQTLGTIDYGIYNVVGGIVTMFGFISSSMTSASQRFFAFELGKNDIPKLMKTFSTTVLIYLFISIIILLLAETIGLWFLNTQMNIPLERMMSANWIYQFSILSFIVTIMTIPYNASIIAHEDMRVFAIVSIIEVLLKLVIVYLLLLSSFDKLKTYGVLIFGVTLLVTFIYRTICKKRYVECRFTFSWDKKLFKEILSYSGWNFIGASSGILKNQGVNILLNIFYGPIVNAANGIAHQMSNVLRNFTLNFSQAVNPQITKSYAVDDKENMFKLVLQSTKFIYFLLFALSMPVLFETNFILTHWIKIIPDYTILFTRLIIIAALIDCLSNSLITSALATGKIKNYQIIIGGIFLLNLPLSYLFLKLGYPPHVTMYISIMTSLLALIFRLLILKQMIGFPIKSFLTKTILPSFLISISAIIIPILIITQLPESSSRFVITLMSSLFCTTIAILTIGLTVGERHFIVNFVRRKVFNYSE